MKNNEVLILLDSDVVIHLLKAEKASLLKDLYDGRLRMLDVVLAELKNNRTVQRQVDGLFLFLKVIEIKFPTTSNVPMFNEYISLKRTIRDDGERACLLYCKYHKHIIASSNTSDITPYCKQHDIAYLTTLDIFCISIERGLLSVKEANQCIQMITQNGSYLAANDIERYKQEKFDTAKLLY